MVRRGWPSAPRTRISSSGNGAILMDMVGQRRDDLHRQGQHGDRQHAARGRRTVAIIETYVPDTSKDEDIDNLSVFIVCRDLRCEVKKLSAANDEPRPSPDGSTVLFGYTYEGAILWTEDEGIHESPWEKVVPVDSGRVSY